MTWDPLPENKQNGIIQYYLVTLFVEQTGVSLSFNTTITSLTIMDLHPAYNYSLQVAAVTIGMGPFSSITSIITPDDCKKHSMHFSCIWSILKAIS